MIDTTLIDFLNALSPYAVPIIGFLMHWAKLELQKRYTSKKLK